MNGATLAETSAGSLASMPKTTRIGLLVLHLSVSI